MRYIHHEHLTAPQVLVATDTGTWPGSLLAQRETPDGWECWVRYTAADGTRTGWFPADTVQVDETDYARGRG